MELEVIRSKESQAKAEQTIEELKEKLRLVIRE
jgi:hypothetical protein